MGFTNWSFDNARDQYCGTREIVGHLPPGMYIIDVTPYGDPLARRKKLKDDAILGFKHGPMKAILREIGSFWDSGERYKSLGVTHKRGVLLHGPAGNGKTGIVAGAISDVVKREGIAIQVADVENFAAAMPLLRQIEPGRNVLVVIEDIDAVCVNYEEELLEVMDGATSLGHGLLFLATTNHLDEIPVRIRCRPSRIDTLIEVPAPDAAQRLEYLRFICHGGFAQHEADLALWAEKSEGFSLASLKELVVSTVIYKRSIDETVGRLKDLSEQKDKED